MIGKKIFTILSSKRLLILIYDSELMEFLFSSIYIVCASVRVLYLSKMHNISINVGIFTSEHEHDTFYAQLSLA